MTQTKSVHTVLQVLFPNDTFLVLFGYCRFGNFHVTFNSRIFDFRIIREVSNSRASICVDGHFRGLKLGMPIVDSQKL